MFFLKSGYLLDIHKEIYMGEVLRYLAFALYRLHEMGVIKRNKIGYELILVEAG